MRKLYGAEGQPIVQNSPDYGRVRFFRRGGAVLDMLAAMGLFFDQAAFISDGTAVLPSMTFDIDVVKDVHDEVQRVTGTAPRLVSMHLPDGYAFPIESTIPIEDLQEISQPRRQTLTLLIDAPDHHDRFQADFRSDNQTRIEYLAGSELVATIANMLIREGTRRPVWKRMTPILPVALATVFTVLTVLVLTIERTTPIEILAGISLITIVGVAAVWSARYLRGKSKYVEQGARFRRASRAAVRDRIVNVRASSWVALVFTPLGAAVGWMLKTWFGA